MIVHAIRAAWESALFDSVVVSTDDHEIAAIARSAGAKTPFVRPASLADDVTATAPVVAHAIQKCNEIGWVASEVCCIYPCAPLLEVSDLKAAYELLVDRKADFVYPVTEFAHPIQRAMRMINDRMVFLHPDKEACRTQDLETTFYDAGMFYWGTAKAWLAGGRMHTDGLGMRVPNWRVVDIDSEDDWIRAELLFRQRQNLSKGGKS